MKNIKKIMTFAALLTISVASTFSMNPSNLFTTMHDLHLYKPVDLLSLLTQALQDKDDAKISSIFSDLSIENKNNLLDKALKAQMLDYSIIKLLLDNQAILYADDIVPFIQADNVDFIRFLMAHQIKAKGCWTNYSFASKESGPESIVPKAIALDAYNILKYLFENNHVCNQTKINSLDCTFKHSVQMVEFLLNQGAQPSQYTISSLLSQQKLHEAEMCLKHPTITSEIKNNLLNQSLEDNYSDDVFLLLTKCGAQISQKTLMVAIKSKNVEKVKLFLTSGAARPTEHALKIATAQTECPQEILDLLLDHGATFSLDTERALLHHSTRIHPKILSTIIKEHNRIKDATDLDDAQKETLLNAYKQLNLYAIFNLQKYDSVASLHYLNIPDALLMKYFPLGIWINEQHDKLNKCATKQINDLEMSDACAGFLQNLKTKKHLTLTEKLFVNIASQNSMAGENSIFSGKDPKEQTYHKRTSHKNYYAAGFIGDLLKTNIIPLVTQAEKEFNAQNYQTFFHGRNWEWNFVNDVWNIVCELKTGEKTSDKISLRFRDQSTDIEQLQKYRTDLLQNGTQYIFGTGVDKKGKESEVTCMNITPMSNPGYYAECTGTYFIDNCSIARGNAAWNKIEQIFKQSNLESYFEQNKDALKALYNQHQKTNKFGELLCIAVKNNALDEIVYAAKVGGLKVTGSATDNIKIVQEGAKASKDFVDTNHTFYCLAVSDMPGEYGTKYTIKSLHMADPEKYEAYKQARDAFAQKMKTDLQMSAQG